MVWDAAWRANLPWAGASTAFTQIADVNQNQMLAALSHLEVIDEGGWQLVRKELDTLSDGYANIFEASGRVAVQGVIGIVTTEVTRAGGVVAGKIGTESDDDVLTGVTADVRAAAGAVWFSTTNPGDDAVAVDLGTDRTFVVAADENIRLHLAEAPDAGAIEFYLWFKPLGADGAVVPAA